MTENGFLCYLARPNGRNQELLYKMRRSYEGRIYARESETILRFMGANPEEIADLQRVWR
jgi:hypothetical protein